MNVNGETSRLREQAVTFWIRSAFHGKENKELANHPPQKHFENVKMVVNVAQEGLPLVGVRGSGVPCLVHFLCLVITLSSNAEAMKEGHCSPTVNSHRARPGPFEQGALLNAQSFCFLSSSSSCHSLYKRHISFIKLHISCSRVLTSVAWLCQCI